MITAMKLSQMPAFTMSPMRMRPVPKTMAFGGVPTGIIKAQDAAKTVAKRIGSGLKCRLPAAASITGIMVAANAVLEVTSETKVTIVETPNIMGSSPIPSKT